MPSHYNNRNRMGGHGRSSRRGSRMGGPRNRAAVTMTLNNIGQWGTTMLETNFQGLSGIPITMNDLIGNGFCASTGNCTLDISMLMEMLSGGSVSGDVSTGTYNVFCGSPSNASATFSIQHSDGGHSHTVNGTCTDTNNVVNIHNHGGGAIKPRRRDPRYTNIAYKQGGSVNPRYNSKRGISRSQNNPKGNPIKK